MRSLGYRPALDGVRGLAIASVIGAHYFGQPRAGYLGVDIFFVLSGFLITALLLTEHEQSGRIDLRAFFVRRVRRLGPALIALLGVRLWIAILAAIELHSAQPLKTGFVQLGIGAFYVANYVAAWAPGLLHVQVLWSLAMEEQFYLVWPLLLLLTLRRRFQPRSLFLGLLVVAALVCTSRILLWLHGAGVTHLYYTPEVAADSLLLGCAAGVACARQLHFVRWVSPFAGLAFLLIVLYLAIGPNRLPAHVDVFGWPLWKTVFAMVVAVGIYGTAQNAGSVITRCLSIRPLVLTGRISYGLYLWHTIFLTSFRPLVALPMTMATSIASYHLVERRFLRRERHTADTGPVSLKAAASAPIEV